MTFFKRAVETSISHSSFVSVGRDNIYTDQSVTNYHLERESRGLGVLRQKIAVGALYNAEERFDAPRCHPQTRVAVQNDIMDWVKHAEDSEHRIPPILWVKGPAGTGKSAIAQSVAESCSRTGALAASFFFSHQFSDRNNKSRLIPTIAHQLATRIPDLREYISEATTNDESIFDQNLESQMNTLILEPVLRARAHHPERAKAWPKGIVIDGLDECEGDAHQLDILDTFSTALLQGLPFRVAFASRPEPAIWQFFSQLNHSSLQTISLADNYDPDSDIRTYLISQFNEIRRKYCIEGPSWPPEPIIDVLVDRASGQFVYAATVLRFIDDPVALPLEHLDIVLGVKIAREAENPFQTLDGLYTTIFNRCPDPAKSAFAIKALNTLTFNPKSQYSKLLAVDCNRFLGWSSADCARLLGRLRSLVDIPPNIIDSPLPNNEGDKSKRSAPVHYSLHHKSVIDFLKTPIRSKSLYIPDNVLFGRLCGRYLRLGLGETYLLKHWGFRVQYELSQFAPWLLQSIPMIPELQLEITNTTYIRNWIRLQIQDIKNGYVHLNVMYDYVHAKEFGCCWHKCSKVCKVWRATIIEEAQRLDWDVESKPRIFQSRLMSPISHSSSTRGSIWLNVHLYEPRRILFIPKELYRTKQGSVRYRSELSEPYSDS